MNVVTDNAQRDKPLIFKVAIPASPCYQLFDYLAPDNNNYDEQWLGCRVVVPFSKGNITKIACLMAIAEQSDYEFEQLKRVSEILDLKPLLSKLDLDFMQWLSRYYHYPLGTVINVAFPSALRQGKAAVINTRTRKSPKPSLSVDSVIICNSAQQTAVDKVCAGLGQFGVFLLEGVTGSGKTEVYMQIIAQVLARGQQVLVLVPEISLTPQLEARFWQRFKQSISISHSGLSQAQRLNAWLNMQQGISSILLGTRSALFTPLPKAGLIILDEEHDSSFKQQDRLRFSARDAAVVRAKLLSIPIVLGSATPSLESLHNAQQQRYQWLPLPQRAGDASAPQLQLIDIRNKKMQQGLSQPLLEAIKQSLERNEQVIIFLNRRGFAPTLMCHACGWVARCKHCDANLVIHKQEHKLRCHHCERKYRLLSHCPQCQSPQLTPLGLGTQQVEQTLNKLFPNKNIIRLDLDSTQRKNTLENFLKQIQENQVDIILGTQLLAKGHHFPNVTLVALLDVDSGLFSVDFHAPEKLAQLIIQVSGRAGRAEKAGKVLLQTRQPEHPLLLTLIKHGYDVFAQQELKERKEAQLPPYSYQALIRAQANNEALPQEFLETIINLARSFNTQQTLILGPVPAPMTLRIGQYRYQLLLQNDNRPALHSFLNRLIIEISQLKLSYKLRWSLDIDPLDLY
ncbi:MAG: primosomal protein N' [Methylococcaceae bacterium]